MEIASEEIKGIKIHILVCRWLLGEGGWFLSINDSKNILHLKNDREWIRNPANSKSCLFIRRKTQRHLIYGIWVSPCACQEKCGNDSHSFSLEISAYLSCKHGLYRRCGKPCTAAKEKFDPCSSIKQSKVVSEVLLKVSVGFKIVCFCILLLPSFQHLQEPHDAVLSWTL